MDKGIPQFLSQLSTHLKMIRTLFKKKNQYPALKLVSIKCPICLGVCFIESKNNTAITCDHCKGLGFIEQVKS